MFKLFKKKLKDSIRSFSKDAEEEVKEVNPEALSEEEKRLLEEEEKELQEQEMISEESGSEELESDTSSDKQGIQSPGAEDITGSSSATQEEKTEEVEASTTETDGEEKGILDEYEGKKKGFFGKVFGKKEKKQEEGIETSEQTSEAIDQTIKKQSTDYSTAENIPEPEEAEQPTSEPDNAEKQAADNRAAEQQATEKQSPEPNTADQPSSDHSEADRQTTDHSETDRQTTEQQTAQPVSEANAAEQQSPEKQKKAAVHEELFEQDVSDATRKKKGFFSKLKNSVTKFQLTEEKFEELFWEFELALLENNVAMEVIEKIKSDMREKLTQENISRRGIDDLILSILKESLEDILDVEPIDIIKRAQEKKPFIITIVGVNGSGKTTTIGKLIRLFQKNDLSVVVAAADTFRAAAIQQLEQHTTKLGVTLIKQEYNSDAAAVAYDAVKHATAKGVDVVLIDTAGRLQSNRNLMDELAKVVRVNNPDFNLFVGEAITGNDCVEQAVQFNNAVGIDGIVLSKADIDDKGGAAISVSYVTKKPILYLGVGQDYDDLELFSKERILERLGLED
ncbi:MAG: signal recognition particle-docking protein FtsY [Candidatus Woesearchaeota archaeon]